MAITLPQESLFFLLMREMQVLLVLLLGGGANVSSHESGDRMLVVLPVLGNVVIGYVGKRCRTNIDVCEEHQGGERHDSQHGIIVEQVFELIPLETAGLDCHSPVMIVRHVSSDNCEDKIVSTFLNIRT